jgi:polyisoprenoid-binding protein YceI
MTIFPEFSFPLEVPNSAHPTGSSSWVVLDKTWAQQLGVTRERGVYRIGRRELARRLAILQQPFAGEWVIDPAHTNVGFIAKHLMVAKVRGGFKQFSGTVSFAQVPEQSWVDMTVDAASIDTGLPVRDDHLRSPDFLDVRNHPYIRFRSTKLEQDPQGSFKMTGDLTLRGVTRPVTMNLDYLGSAQDLSGNLRMAFEAKALIDREEFGLTWNRVLDSGGVLVGKQVGLEIEAEAVRRSVLPAA